ncbi:hypothetical protein QTQ03_17990 [Micromonospora sp. WMMA1363]|nr:hypothetical protein [Micromonospora sp. WMMA1363]MDM4721399.1 hypothetical protein [Micromonospora sp. WMMA1363]
MPYIESYVALPVKSRDLVERFSENPGESAGPPRDWATSTMLKIGDDVGSGKDVRVSRDLGVQGQVPDGPLADEAAVDAGARPRRNLDLLRGEGAGVLRRSGPRDRIRVGDRVRDVRAEAHHLRDFNVTDTLAELEKPVVTVVVPVVSSFDMG